MKSRINSEADIVDLIPQVTYGAPEFVDKTGAKTLKTQLI
jgi:hypothetical protein